MKVNFQQGFLTKSYWSRRFWQELPHIRTHKSVSTAESLVLALSRCVLSNKINTRSFSLLQSHNTFDFSVVHFQSVKNFLSVIEVDLSFLCIYKLEQS
jgi:hypothetical protein